MDPQSPEEREYEAFSSSAQALLRPRLSTLSRQNKHVSSDRVCSWIIRKLRRDAGSCAGKHLLLCSYRIWMDFIYALEGRRKDLVYFRRTLGRPYSWLFTLKLPTVLPFPWSQTEFIDYALIIFYPSYWVAPCQAKLSPKNTQPHELYLLYDKGREESR